MDVRSTSVDRVEPISRLSTRRRNRHNVIAILQPPGTPRARTGVTGVRMRVADIKRRMTAARKFASNAKPPSAKPKKHKREPAEVSDSSDTEEEDFRVDAKRPRFARDLPHARASLSPGAARKFASNAAPPRPKPPRPAPPPPARKPDAKGIAENRGAAKKFATNASFRARKPRAKPAPPPKPPPTKVAVKPKKVAAQPKPRATRTVAKKPAAKSRAPRAAIQPTSPSATSSNAKNGPPPEAWTLFRRKAPVKGPCEHGVEPSCRCKECMRCPHGKWKNNCVRCRKAGFCKHEIPIIKCVRCAGGFVCEHGREKAVCKQCIGHETCPHGTSRVKCKTCSVWRKSLCPHGRQSYFCRDCAAEGIGGKGICEHNKEERRCRDCKGWGLCPHGKVKTRNCVRCVEEAHALFMKKKTNAASNDKSRSRSRR
mmetsp:Transcript_10625/g.48796  ORF Transcript_10625/g.48796 Transcript_10625/m.48796 type:complete len:427 (-) Transcript_10625:1367-2647(-)